MIMEHVTNGVGEIRTEKEGAIRFIFTEVTDTLVVPGLDYNFLQRVTWTILQGKHFYILF